MKLLCWTVCGALALHTHAQDKLGGLLPLENGKVTYTGVITVDSLSADQIYLGVRRWVAKEYKSGKDVTQLEDAAAREVLVRGWFPSVWQLTFYATNTVQVWHRVTVQCRDGRYRFEFTDFRIKWQTGEPLYQEYEQPIEEWFTAREKQVGKVYAQVDTTVRQMVQALIQAVVTAMPVDDW